MGRSVEPSSISSEDSPARRRGSASDAPPDLRVEKLLWKHGVGLIAGIDEAGRGAWAGPVVAAAVILPNDEYLTQTLLPGIQAVADEPIDFAGVRDSKPL